MARNQAFKKAAAKRDGGRFVALPCAVIQSNAYLHLSAHGVKLLIDLLAQYNGNNNGDLCMAWKLMQPRGWKSEETLHKAKRQLCNAKLIAETRKGARPNKASLYGLTFYELDFCGGKLDIDRAAFPRGAWRLLDPLPALKPKKAYRLNGEENTHLATASVVVAK